MERAEAVTPARLFRLLLCGLGVAGGLVLLALAFGSLSASADEATPPPAAPASSPGASGSGSGLLGSVGTVLGAVTTPVSNAVGTITSSVSSVVNPVTQALPAPVQQAVAPVTDAVTSAVQSVSVTQAVTPVTGALDNVIDGVPVVGATLSSALGSFSSATTPVTGAVDGTIGDVGQLTAGIFGPPSISNGTDPGASVALPSADGTPSFVSTEAAGTLLPATTTSNFVWASADRADSGSNGVAMGAGSTSGSQDSSAPDAPPGATGTSTSGSSSGSGGSAGGTAAIVTQGAGPAGAIGRAGGGTPDDRLPSTPTYDTDSTPD